MLTTLRFQLGPPSSMARLPEAARGAGKVHLLEWDLMIFRKQSPTLPSGPGRVSRS